MTVEEFLCGVSVSEVSFVDTYVAKAKIYPIHNYNRAHHGFIYTVTGEETYNLGDRSFVATPNSILYLPKGSKYEVTLVGEVSVVIHIEFEVCGAEAHSPFLIKFDEDKTVMPLFADAEKCYNKNRIDRQAELKSVFYKIASRMVRRNDGYITVDGYSKIAESVSYLHSHYLEGDFRISKLYETSGISSRYYERLFFKKFGETPKEYLLKMKIEFAKELLLFEKSSISDIAAQLGYNDIYHFSKIFKAKTGYTPGQYRKIMHGEEK